MYLGMAAFGRYRLYHAQYLCLNSCLRTYPKSFLPTSNPSASFPPPNNSLPNNGLETFENHPCGNQEAQILHPQTMGADFFLDVKIHETKIRWFHVASHHSTKRPGGFPKRRRSNPSIRKKPGLFGLSN